jgi:hypothetical protein
MPFAPITKQAINLVAVATLVPVAPLILTVVPPEQLVKTLARVLF